jgi:hypothetical protein
MSCRLPSQFLSPAALEHYNLLLVRDLAERTQSVTFGELLAKSITRVLCIRGPNLLSRRVGDKPFFLWYNSTAMHFRPHLAAKNRGKSGKDD